MSEGCCRLAIVPIARDTAAASACCFALCCQSSPIVAPQHTKLRPRSDRAPHLLLLLALLIARVDGVALVDLARAGLLESGALAAAPGALEARLAVALELVGLEELGGWVEGRRANERRAWRAGRIRGHACIAECAACLA